ncbi:hypothetical protein GCM10009430_00740 [Aquimarina litoralis]|uniref:Efflux RND transporter periplasmic adaptor subunit n=1 Tax=Aquimarina litoralis TaxID=584605 RepID=A0ABP3TKX5_9FLAO
MEKKSAIYLIVVLFVGVGIGYLLFGSSSQSNSDHAHDENTEVVDQIWTCSMHPQIKQSESGDCPICGMDLIPTTNMTADLDINQFRMTENAMALANIQTSIVGDGSTNSQEIRLSGKIEENEEETTVQVTHFTGRIEKLLVNAIGEKIAKGQRIALIYSPELVAAQQELLTAAKLKEQQPELYKAVRNKLKLRKLSENQINQIESSGNIMEMFPLHAQVSGIVSEKMVEEGNHIERGQVLYKISNLNTVWANFDVYENQISIIQKGQEINIMTTAYPDTKIKAKISFIDPILNKISRTVSARAVLTNKDALFKPGMFIEGVISVSDNDLEKENIVVPKSAVLWTGKRSLVYVKKKGITPVFEMREVVLGNSNSDSYQILSGLQKGEEIVTNGTFTVDAAAQLQGKKSMMKLGGNQSDSAKDVDFEKVAISVDFRKLFNQALLSYFSLKDALVASDANLSATFSEKMLSQLKNLNISELPQEELAYLQNLKKHLQGISDKEELINQRAHFKDLNKNLNLLIHKIGNTSETIYIQKCPMANDNKGAIWLSKEKEVRNPYFGDAMLACGSVINTLERL